MVPAEDSAAGTQSERAARPGAEERIRQAVGFAGSRFLQGDVSFISLSGPNYACAAAVIERKESTNETPAHHGPCARRSFMCRAGRCRGVDRDAQENQGNRYDHPRLSRL